MRKIDSILSETLKKIQPEKEELILMHKEAKIFLEKIKKSIKELKIEAEPFIGGSFAKNTIVKKNNYDCDIFLRFTETNEDISKLANKIIDKAKIKARVVHGSRDYFQIPITDYFYIELLPVKKTETPESAENITDLSYLHVKYLNKKIKSQKIIDDIKLIKAFCHAKECYGAESYINGFSGYSLELLIYHFNGFEKFLKEIVKKDKKQEQYKNLWANDFETKIKKWKNRIMIDIEKAYKNSNHILMDLNESKLNSPIILIDPTFKERNVTAALSEETFKKFIIQAKNFLKNPKETDFKIKIEDVENIKKLSKKNNYEFIELKISTTKQNGDIAGTKLKKFYKHLIEELKKIYEIKKSGFVYNKEQSAKIYFTVKKKNEIILKGPEKNNELHVKAFKKEHKNAKIKGNRYISIKKINFTLNEFIKKWQIRNKVKIKEMTISKLKIL